MACPADMTLANLSGKFVMNRKLSDPLDPLFVLQGVPWLLRKAAPLATVTLSINTSIQPTDGVTILNISIVSTGGFGAQSETRSVDGSPFEQENKLIGAVKGRCQWVTSEEVGRSGDGKDVQFLRGILFYDGKKCEEGEGWEEEQDGSGGQRVHFALESVGKGWVAEQVGGIERVEGERMYVRRWVVRKGGKVEMARMVYDYVGKVAE
ncbi:MAG: hypothetical protein MMC33_008359 [Icmadophila ericetorum]|nr:hypothetical protein [Icmadophila ericetorum]